MAAPPFCSVVCILHSCDAYPQQKPRRFVKKIFYGNVSLSLVNFQVGLWNFLSILPWRNADKLLEFTIKVGQIVKAGLISDGKNLVVFTSQQSH